MQILKCSADAVGHDLATSDQDYIQDDHTAPETRRRQLLDVQGRDARREADTNANQEPTPYLRDELAEHAHRNDRSRGGDA